MTRELIGGFPAANDREQIGRFLRYAFPVGLESFKELPGRPTDGEKAKSPRRH
jgi:hypothetical protein